MNNHINAEQKFLARTQSDQPSQWGKPEMTATPLNTALSGGFALIDGGSTVVEALLSS